MKKIIFLFILIVFSGTAHALTLDEAKDQGFVGETFSGYLEATPKGDSQVVKNLINEINSKRKQKYIEISQQTQTTLSNVEVLAGKKAVSKTRAGHYFKTAAGAWKSK